MVSSQSRKSSGNSWAMNPFCSNPVSEWTGDDDKHSKLNISCPAFPLAFSSMTVNCWLMRHQHCFVSIYPSMEVFWRQLAAWDGQLYVNQHYITENTTAECAGNCRNLHSWSQFLGSYKSGNSNSGLFQLFSLSTWRDEHGLKHQTQMPLRILKFVFSSYCSITQIMFVISLDKWDILYYTMISAGQQTLLLFICTEKLHVKWNRLRLQRNNLQKHRYPIEHFISRSEQGWKERKKEQEKRAG